MNNFLQSVVLRVAVVIQCRKLPDIYNITRSADKLLGRLRIMLLMLSKEFYRKRRTKGLSTSSVLRDSSVLDKFVCFFSARRVFFTCVLNLKVSKQFSWKQNQTVVSAELSTEWHKTKFITDSSCKIVGYLLFFPPVRI